MTGWTAPGERVSAPVALVTGATSGIGFATAETLARRNARVLVHGRSEQSANEAVAGVRRAVPGAHLDAVWGDLATMAEVRALAAQVLQFPRLDVLIHNAGVEHWERRATPDGFEATLAVNHLAPFLLTRLLAPLLEYSRPSRIVYISSVVHRWGEIHWDDLQATKWYAPEPAYYQSKLAAALVSAEFARRLAPRGISVFLVAPGLTRTRFTREFRGPAALWARAVGPLVFRAPERVAREVAAVSLSPAFAAMNGAYVARLRPGLPAARARVVGDQRRLWDLTCTLLGLPSDDELPSAT